MKMLVGYTGFVGSNLLETMFFDEIYNSKNIQDAYGKNPDLMIYAGVKGTKFLANKYPDEDRKNINEAIHNIIKINPKKLVLISTIDVYDNLDCKDEDYIIKPELLHDYGKNRYFLEQWVCKNVNDYHIIRLPAIYGKNLKKNFIYDLINPIPRYLNRNDYDLIKIEFKNIDFYYNFKEHVYELYKIDMDIYRYFINSKYSTIRFTDYRANYQYLNLNILSDIIREMIDKNIKIVNAVSEPVNSMVLYEKVKNKSFLNKLDIEPINYNIITKHKFDFCLNIKDKYLFSANAEITDLCEYIIMSKKELKRELEK